MSCLMLTPLEIDFSDAFTRVKHGGEGMMWGIKNVPVVFESHCNSGVQQGDPPLYGAGNL